MDNGLGPFAFSEIIWSEILCRFLNIGQEMDSMETIVNSLVWNSSQTIDCTTPVPFCFMALSFTT